MPKQTLEALVDGGAASAGPPLGPALGPTGIPIKKVIDAINDKTKLFAGMKVPVRLVLDTDTKNFDVVVGTPATSQLVKKEVKLETLAKKPGGEWVADIRIEHAIKIAKMKESSLYAKDPIGAVKEVIGTCVSIGVLVEGKNPKDVIKDIEKGAFKEKILAGKTELTKEELEELERKKVALAEELKKRLETERALAQKILAEMAGQEEIAIRKRMATEKISEDIIEETIKGGAAATPAAGEKKEAKKEEKK